MSIEGLGYNELLEWFNTLSIKDKESILKELRNQSDEMHTCPFCNGDGYSDGIEMRRCSPCYGNGKIPKMRPRQPSNLILQLANMLDRSWE